MNYCNVRKKEKDMKLKFVFGKTINLKYDLWMFHLLPILFITRNDTYNDEKAYYFGIGWLIFQCNFIIRLPKKREEETEYVGPATDCQQ